MERGDNFETLCRFCLGTLYDDSKLNIFHTGIRHSNVLQKILNCLSLIVSEDDSLPNYICFSCAEKLDSFQDFRDTCHKSESYFMKLVSMKDVSISPAPKSQNRQGARSQNRMRSVEPDVQEPQQVFVKVEKQYDSFDELLPHPSRSVSIVPQRSYSIAQIANVNQSEAILPAGGERKIAVKTEDLETVSEANSDFILGDSSIGFEDSMAYGDGVMDASGDNYPGHVGAQATSAQGDDDGDIVLLSDDSDSESAKVISQVPSEPKTKRARKTVSGESSTASRGSMPGTSQQSFVITSNASGLSDISLQSITPKKKCACPTCNKLFFTPAELKRHIRTHTKEKPFKCELCGRGFSLKGNLKTHYLVHRPDAPFVCHVCSRSYATEEKLKIHSLIHSSTKLR